MSTFAVFQKRDKNTDHLVCNHLKSQKLSSTIEYFLFYRYLQSDLWQKIKPTKYGDRKVSEEQQRYLKSLIQWLVNPRVFFCLTAIEL